MELGPVEYLLIAFPGNNFTGEIVPALTELVSSGTVRILDLVFVRKETDGSVTFVEFDALDDAVAFDSLDGEAGGLFSEEDVELAAAALEPGSSAALLVWEDLWAAPLAKALRDADAVLIEGSRIPHSIAVAAFDGIS